MHRSRPLLFIYSTQITSKNLYSKNGADFIKRYRNSKQKLKKLSRPQGTEKLGDTTLINATAFTHPTVNAGATPVISRNSEVGSPKGDVKAFQPWAFSLKHTFAYCSSSTFLHYKKDFRQKSRFCQCLKKPFHAFPRLFLIPTLANTQLKYNVRKFTQNLHSNEPNFTCKFYDRNE